MTIKVREKLPWKEPESMYDDDGADCDVTIEGHTFEVRDTGDVGIDSGRTRWKVTCTTCNVVCHERTTGAAAHIRYHLREKGLDVE